MLHTEVTYSNTTLLLHRQLILAVALQGLHDFLPVRNIRTLVPQIRTLEGDCLLMLSLVLLLRHAAQYVIVFIHDTIHSFVLIYVFSFIPL